MGENGVTIILAALGSAGLWQLIIYLVNRRANQRKAEAEADKEIASALAAKVGVKKAGYEAESVAVTNAQTVMAQAIVMMESLGKELDEAKKEKMQAMNEKRELQVQIRQLESDVQQMSRKFNAMELVVIDIAGGVKRLSDQLRERGLEPIWKPTFTIQQLDGVLSDDVRSDVEKLLQ